MTADGVRLEPAGLERVDQLRELWLGLILATGRLLGRCRSFMTTSCLGSGAAQCR
jgi:hypothetical protein